MVSRWYDMTHLSYRFLIAAFLQVSIIQRFFSPRHFAIQWSALWKVRRSRSSRIVDFSPSLNLSWRISLNIIQSCRHGPVIRRIKLDPLLLPSYYLLSWFVIRDVYDNIAYKRIAERGKALSRREKLVCLTRCTLYLEDLSFRSDRTVINNSCNFYIPLNLNI